MNFVEIVFALTLLAFAFVIQGKADEQIVDNLEQRIQILSEKIMELENK